MKKFLNLYIVLLFTASYAQTLPPSGVSTNENFIYSRVYLEAVTTSSTTAKQIQSISYFDGIGRPKQNVSISATPLGKDIVLPIVYDGFGRQTREYLPVPQNATANGAIYTQNQALVSYPVSDPNNFYNNEKIYSEKSLELSPLNRVFQQYQVGNDWSAKPINFSYDTNSLNDVKKYVCTTTWVNNATSSSYTVSGYYPVNTLFKNTVTDEDGSISTEFKNGQGQILMVRKNDGTQDVDTYYVYNEYDQLALVIPPLAVNQSLTQSILDNLCYQYRYDDQNHVVEKKLPGKGWEYMIFDKKDRLVATQDALLGASQQWLFTKYDQFDRIAYTGIYTSSNAYNGAGRNAEQTLANAAGANFVERKATVDFTQNGQGVYYGNPTTGTTYPASIAVLYTVNYYDSYPPDMVITQPASIQGKNTLTSTFNNGRSIKGLPTASYVKNIEDHNWTKTYTFYDTNARAIGTYSQNHLGGYTKTESVLDFTGVPQNSYAYHKRLSTDVETLIKEKFEYDSQNRIIKHWHNINNAAVDELLTYNEYNEIGQLKNKKVGGSIALPLQTVDYTYNIRGWMTKINDPSNLGNDLFGFEVKYQNPDYSKSIPSAKYNGNISQTSWATATSGTIRTYTYLYDKLNRLTNSRLWDSQNLDAGKYQENLSYDVNGNIASLYRTGGFPTSTYIPEMMDDLQYYYENSNLSNRLSYIREKGTGNAQSGYPLAMGQTGQVITYDTNGNMTSQIDKNISSIQYNFLNLPKQVIQSGVTTYYTYRGDGVKQRKVYGSTTTDYLDGFQYVNGILQFFPTGEGYYDKANGKYVYNYVDHLGNVRVSYADSNKNGVIDPTTEIIEKNNYYPFGLKHEGYDNLLGNPNYKYKYNGKELQETGMYDYGARMYMPDIGRWGVVDPLAEKSTRWSPYNYVYNNPIRFIDPDGMQAGELDDFINNWASGVNSENGNLPNGEKPPGWGLGKDNKWHWVENISSANYKNLGYSEYLPAGSYLNNIPIEGKESEDTGVTYLGSGYAMYLPTGSNSNGSTGFVKLSNWFRNAISGTTSAIASQFSGGWDSNVIRSFTGDFLNIGVGFSGISGGGAGTSWEFNWILHGPEASFYPSLTTTPSLGGGFNVDATFNIGTLNYTGSSFEINRNMLITNTANRDIPTTWGAGSLTAGGEIGAMGTATRLNGGKYLIGGQLNIGLGIPLGPVPFNGSGGVSNTYLIHDFYKK